MNTKQLCWLLPLACLGACSNGANHESYATNDSAAEAAGAPISASITSPERKIIRTADLTCKVANVVTAVDSLERKVTALGGIVEESNIVNTNGGVTSVYYTPDSLKELHTYTTTATLTLRVPVAMLDSVVRSIPSLVTFIDSRRLKQTDVTGIVMGNEALLKTGNKVYSAQHAVKLAKNSEDLVKVQEYEDQNTIQQVNRKVENMQLMDEVNYSTLIIALDQPQRVYTQVVVNPDYVARVPFGLRVKQALADGLDALGCVFVGLVALLPFLLALSVLLFVYMRWRKRMGHSKAALQMK